MDNFDYIVVGGGSSGCVMAARLSENPSNKVLLIESGLRDSSPWIKIPATFFKVVEKGRDVVAYAGEKSPLLNNRDSIVLQGHVIGGGSSVNAMLYVRGQPQDYDDWAAAGNTAWAFEDVLPVFRDLENNMEIADEFHGTDGELHVSETGFHHPLSRAYILAAQQAGIPYNADFNGAEQTGCGFYQTTTHDGRRWSAAEAFLRKAEKRGNLKIMTSTRVAKVEFDGTRCTDVTLQDRSRISATQEVVLCAGAIETPRLLQLSGIGGGRTCRTTVSRSSVICRVLAKITRTISKSMCSAIRVIPFPFIERIRACVQSGICCSISCFAVVCSTPTWLRAVALWIFPARADRTCSFTCCRSWSAGLTARRLRHMACR